MSRSRPNDLEWVLQQIGQINAFFQALAARDWRAIQRMVQSHPWLVSSIDSDRRTALHVAVRLCWPKLAKFLLDHGADVHARGASGETPLHCFRSRRTRRKSWTPWDETLCVLMSGRADLEALDKDERTALHWTLWAGDTAATQSLLEAGADEDIFASAAIGDLPHVLSLTGHNPSLVALAKTCPNMRRILDADAEVLHRPDRLGNTPLHWAAAFGQAEVVDWLLAHGASPDVRNHDGQTPLELALARKPRRMTELWRQTLSGLGARKENPG